jgi:hypothetical protein
MSIYRYSSLFTHTLVTSQWISVQKLGKHVNVGGGVCCKNNDPQLQTKVYVCIIDFFMEFENKITNLASPLSKQQTLKITLLSC